MGTTSEAGASDPCQCCLHILATLCKQGSERILSCAQGAQLRVQVVRQAHGSHNFRIPAIRSLIGSFQICDGAAASQLEVAVSQASPLRSAPSCTTFLRHTLSQSLIEALQDILESLRQHCLLDRWH